MPPKRKTDDTPSPARVERAMSAAMQVRALLVQETSDVDNQLLADMIEGETEAMELIDRIVEQSIADKMLVEAARARAQRLENRAERCRTLVQQMMEELGLEKMERATYSATLTLGPVSVVIEDDTRIPPEYLRTSPDKDKIKKAINAGDIVPGALLNNRKVVLRVLTR